MFKGGRTWSLMSVGNGSRKTAPNQERPSPGTPSTAQSFLPLVAFRWILCLLDCEAHTQDRSSPCNSLTHTLIVSGKILTDIPTDILVTCLVSSSLKPAQLTTKINQHKVPAGMLGYFLLSLNMRKQPNNHRKYF